MNCPNYTDYKKKEKKSENSSKDLRCYSVKSAMTRWTQKRLMRRIRKDGK